MRYINLLLTLTLTLTLTISETRKDRGKVTMRAYRSIGSHQLSFERYHPRPPTASLSPRLRFATPTQNFNRYYLILVTKATDFRFGRYIHRVHPNKSPLKIFEKRERWRIQELSKVFKYPILSHERVKLRTSNFVRTFIGSIGTKTH